MKSQAMVPNVKNTKFFIIVSVTGMTEREVELLASMGHEVVRKFCNENL